MQIASITTNEQGEYEYTTEEDYLEQTLDIIIQKEGFERKNISYEIDKAQIKSDILLNELENGTKEKTRIFGTILNSNNRDLVKDASITLSIEGTQIAAITSNELGGYEYTAEEDYTGQTLDYVIQKKGFIRKDISHEIERFEIESDFLMDEIEIKIKGKICDETDSPLDNASISFSIGNSTIDLTSDKDGSFSFTVGQQFLNQSIGYKVNKEGFEIKSGKLKLLEDLKCINISKSIPPNVPDKSKWIKNAVVGIGLVGLTVLVIYLFGLAGGPDLSTNPDPIDFDFEPGTDAQTFSIQNNGDVTLEWDVYSDRDWIIVSPDSGTDSGTVSVSVNNAGMDRGRHTGIITVESNGGTETGRISLDITEPESTREPTAEPTREPTAEPTLETPIIDDFWADPEHINGPKGETTLSWEVSGATSVTIDGIGDVGVSVGSIQTWVSHNTTFTIRATNDAGISDVRTITVNVEEHPPKLSVNLDSLDFNFDTIDEGNTDYQIFSISNNGSGTLEWNISTAPSWIIVSPTSGTEFGSVTVSVNTTMKDPGDYTGEIIIESNGGTENVIISLHVMAPLPDKNEALEFSLKIVETYFSDNGSKDFYSYLGDTIYFSDRKKSFSKDELEDGINRQPFPFGNDYSKYNIKDYNRVYNYEILDHKQYSEEYPSISKLNIDDWSPDNDDFLFIGYKVKKGLEQYDIMEHKLLVFMVTYQKEDWKLIAVSG